MASFDHVALTSAQWTIHDKSSSFWLELKVEQTITDKNQSSNLSRFALVKMNGNVTGRV